MAKKNMEKLSSELTLEQVQQELSSIDNYLDGLASADSFTLNEVRVESAYLFPYETKVDELSKNPNLDDETKEKIRAIDDKLNKVFSAMLEKVELSGDWLREFETDVQDIYSYLDMMEQSKRNQYIQEIEWFRTDALIANVEDRLNQWWLTASDGQEIVVMLWQLEAMASWSPKKIQKIEDLKKKFRDNFSRGIDMLHNGKNEWIYIREDQVSFVHRGTGKTETIKKEEYKDWDIDGMFTDFDDLSDELKDMEDGDILKITNDKTDRTIVIWNQAGKNYVYSLDMKDIDGRFSSGAWYLKSELWVSENIFIGEKLKNVVSKYAKTKWVDADRLLMTMSAIVGSNLGKYRNITNYAADENLLWDKFGVEITWTTPSLLKQALATLKRNQAKMESAKEDLEDESSSGVVFPSEVFDDVKNEVQGDITLDKVKESQQVMELPKDKHIVLSYAIAKVFEEDRLWWKSLKELKTDKNMDVVMQLWIKWLTDRWEDFEWNYKTLDDAYKGIKELAKDYSNKDEVLKQLDTLDRILKEGRCQVGWFRTSFVDFLEWDWQSGKVKKVRDQIEKENEEIKENLEKMSEDMANTLEEHCKAKGLHMLKSKEEIKEWLQKWWRLGITGWDADTQFRVGKTIKEIVIANGLKLWIGFGGKVIGEHGIHKYGFNAWLWGKRELVDGLTGTYEVQSDLSTISPTGSLWLVKRVKEYWYVSGKVFAGKGFYGGHVGVERDRAEKLNLAMERIREAGKKTTLEFGPDGFVSDLKINLDDVDLDSEQKELFEEKKAEFIKEINWFLNVTDTAQAREEVKMDVLNKALEHKQVQFNKDDEGWALDGAWLGLVFFEPMMISPTIVMDMIVPYISLKFGKVERKCKPTADSCKIVDAMIRKQSDSKAPVLLWSMDGINIEKVKQKLRDEKLLEGVNITTGIFKDPDVKANYSNGVVKFYGESPIVKEAVVIEGDEIIVLYYVFSKENAGKYLDFTKMDRDYTIINGVMWDKFNVSRWANGKEEKIVSPQTFTPNISAQYDKIESELNMNKLKNSTIINTITDVKLWKMTSSDAVEIKKGMESFLQVYNSKTRDYNKAFAVLSQMPMLSEYTKKISSMSPELQTKAKLYIVNTMANMFATSKEITRATEKWWKIMWWSWLWKDVDLKNKTTAKDLLPWGEDAAKKLWILKNGRLADFTKFENNLQKYLAIREIFDVPYAGGKTLGSRYEWQIAEYEKIWLSWLMTKDQYLDMIMNIWTPTTVNNIVATGVINHKSLNESQRWLYGILGSADFISTSALNITDSEKANILGALNSQGLLEGAKLQIVSMLEANGVWGNNLSSIAEQLVTTWAYNDGITNLTLWWDFMSGLTSWGGISFMIANMTVNGAVNGNPVSMIVDSSIWGSVVTWATYNWWNYSNTNSFGASYSHPIQNETDNTPEPEPEPEPEKPEPEKPEDSPPENTPENTPEDSPPEDTWDDGWEWGAAGGEWGGEGTGL